MSARSTNADAAGRLWFPFTSAELELALGFFGALATVLCFAGAERPVLAWSALTYVVLVYLAGLLVQARRRHRRFDFIEDGALEGRGYLPFLRGAQRSLFLTHVDEDAPSEELQALYRSLLRRGVALRRVVFLRPGGRGTGWVGTFGNHPGLTQRVVLPELAELTALSFVVVDEALVIVSVPGYDALDADEYAPRFVLRHLVVLHDEAVAKVFLKVHGQLWEHAQGLPDAQALLDPATFLARARARGAA